MPVEVGFQVVDRIRRQVSHLRRRIETNPLHQSIVEGRATQAGYVALLQKMWSFQVGFESQVAERREWLGFEFDFHRRKKQAAIEQDLKHFETALPARVCELPLQAASIGFVCGYLYVVESGTLTGQNEFRILSRKWGIGPGTGGSYLYAYGDDTGQRWWECQDLLERVGTIRMGSANEMVSGATDAYRRLDECLREGS
jgi:heme oxygenase